MHLSAQEKLFIEKRIKFARSWPIAGVIMILVLAILCLWLFLSRPLLINPWFVLSQLRADVVQESTLIVMAAILPVAMLMCIVMAIFFILIGFSVFSRERKYISIIHRMINEHTEKSDLQ